MNDNLNVERNKRLLMRLGNLNQKYKSNTVTSEDFTETGTSYSMNVVANNILGTNISSGMKVVDYKINMDGTLVIIGDGGEVVTEFNIGSGFNDYVYSIIETTDGSYLIGGSFTAYSGETANYIIKLKSDGAIDDSFNSGDGFNSSVYSMIETTDGGYLIGGAFTSYSGEATNCIFKLKQDATIDTSFKTGGGCTGIVYSMIETTDNGYLIGGGFNSYSGVSINRLVKVKQNGDIDASLNIGDGFNGDVRSIIKTSDNSYLIGGGFTTYSGQTANHLIKLKYNGDIDTSFNIGSGFNAGVSNLIKTSDGGYLVGGEFTSYSGQTANYIIKLKSDGNIDDTFNVGSGFIGSYVKSIIETTNGGYLVGGDFTSYSGQTANYIIKLKSDGAIDDSFNVGSGFDDGVSSIQQTTDGGYLVGGGFTSYSGQTANNIIKLKSDGISITISE